MEFEWDEEKRKRVIRDHGVDFEHAKKAFSFPRIEDDDLEQSETEDRVKMIGWTGSRVIVLIYTERRGKIRLITARHADVEEELLYYQTFFGEPF
ncbi:MAG: BrnT family toxin [Alphaproteobacteria bacterium]|nr:BrnT family toxin [Alphaproteobacteria bacterium]